jgi:hypothetical protein
MNHYSQEELEKFLKERADQYLIYPSDSAWSNIERKLHPNRIWTYLSLAFLMFGISGSLVMLNVEDQKEVPAKTGQIAYQFIESDPIEKSFKNLHSITVSTPKEHLHTGHLTIHNNTIVTTDEIAIEPDQEIVFESYLDATTISIPETVLTLQGKKSKNIRPSIKAEMKKLFVSTFETVVAQAKKISKKASWQLYATPTVSYRKLTGQASSASYQYSTYSYSTNSVFARDVNDAVRHKPGIGLEIGTSMLYPLGKKLTLKTGLQLNYNHYNIEAYRGVPEIANYGMNNVGYGGRVPISAISYYRNADGYRPATLRNEHYMISMPIGLDLIVAGNKKANFSVASTIQPTYVFANYSYLISSNLKNYAKEPSLNKRWNVNSSFEANVNIQKGDYKLSFGPQFRYQMMSSFKNKYPIKENLMDIGLKLGVTRTIR